MRGGALPGCRAPAATARGTSGMRPASPRGTSEEEECAVEMIALRRVKAVSCKPENPDWQTGDLGYGLLSAEIH